MRCLLLPCRQTDQEIVQLLRGLDGQYVPSGPAGAPTRSLVYLPVVIFTRLIRAIPTETAWDVGVSYCTD